MDNFTPLKTEKKKKKVNKFLLVSNIFLMIFVVGLTGYYLQNQLISKDSQAGCRWSSEEKSCARINYRQKVYKGGYAGEYTATVNKNDGSGGKKVVPVWFTSAEGRRYIKDNTFYNKDGTIKSQTQELIDAFKKAGFPADFIDGGSCQDAQGNRTNDSIYCIAAGNCNTTTNNGLSGSSTDAGGSTNPNENCNGWHYSICPVGIPPYCTDSGGGGEDATPTPKPPTPTATPIISNTPTPIPTATDTPTPTPTSTDTPTPTVTTVISNTPTVTPIISNTPGPTTTPVPVVCGTKDCDNATRPCASGLSCVQSSNGSNYCSLPNYITACKANPSYDTCCSAPGAPTATPTEIILAKVSTSPTTVVKLLQTGVVKSFMYFIPAAIMLVGLIL